MTEEKTETELAQLEQAMVALEDHHGTLGDVVVDVAQVSVREK